MLLCFVASLAIKLKITPKELAESCAKVDEAMTFILKFTAEFAKIATDEKIKELEALSKKKVGK